MKAPYRTINGKKERLNRIVMQECIGRPLETFEHVFHKNGDALDNALENLVIIKKLAKKER